MRLQLIPTVIAVLAMSACGAPTSPSPSVASPPATTPVTAPATSTAPVVKTPTAGSASDALKAQIPSITKLVTITEENDPNDKIGRPNGYTAAVVLFDSRTKCTDGLGSSCGATIEQWPTPADAKARMDYIQGILKDSPMLGSEYDYLRGGLLLRVDGALKPSAAAAYKTAFAE